MASLTLGTDQKQRQNKWSSETMEGIQLENKEKIDDC